jgi:hypothetical protein
MNDAIAKMASDHLLVAILVTAMIVAALGYLELRITKDRHMANVTWMYGGFIIVGTTAYYILSHL